MEQNPTTITTSKEYVAYELAIKILAEEYGTKSSVIEADFRKHFLDLYAECLEATDGRR